MSKKKSKSYENAAPDEASVVQEPAIDLVRLPVPKTKRSRPSAITSHRKPANQLTPMEKLEIIKKGVTKTVLESLKQAAGLDYDTLAQGLSTARATLINIKGEDTFNFAVSEKIMGLEDIYTYGYDVFGDKEKFNRWMFRRNAALGNYTPFELVNNQFGREEVKSLIGRIEYGVYS